MNKLWFYLLVMVPIIPVSIIIYFLSLYTGLDLLIRLYLSLSLCFFYLLIVIAGIYFKNRKVKYGQIFIGVLATILFLGSTYYSYMIVRVHSALDDMTANLTLVHQYSLVAMANFDVENLSGETTNRVGLLNLSNEQSVIEIDEFLVNQTYMSANETIIYDSPISLIRALYAGEIDGMIIGSNFAQLFEDIGEFENIEVDTIVLTTFSIETDNIATLEPMDISEPFTVLILGSNSIHEEDLSGNLNTFMLATINFENLSFTLTSIPRDSYVPVPCFNYQYDKLSHTNIGGGMACTVETIEHMFDLEISHFVHINFRGFLEVVDALGGITVDVPMTFSEQDSRRRFGQHMITVEEGVQRLNGEQALALARHRRTLINQDLGRVVNQQLVLDAILREIFEEITSVHEFLPIFTALGRNIDTNFTMHDITALAQHTLEFLPALSDSNLMDEIHLMNWVLSSRSSEVSASYGHGLMSIEIPFEGAIRDSRQLMAVNLGLEEPAFNFTFEFNGFSSSFHTRWIHLAYDELVPAEVNHHPSPDLIIAPEPIPAPPPPSWTPPPELAPEITPEEPEMAPEIPSLPPTTPLPPPPPEEPDDPEIE